VFVFVVMFVEVVVVADPGGGSVGVDVGGGVGGGVVGGGGGDHDKSVKYCCVVVCMLQVVDFNIKCMYMPILTSSPRSIVEALNTRFEFFQASDTSAFICSPSMRHVIRVVKMCVASHRHGIFRLAPASVCSYLSSVRPHLRCSRKRRHPAPLEHVTKNNREGR
jgi:hypothetical protein